MVAEDLDRIAVFSHGGGMNLCAAMARTAPHCRPGVMHAGLYIR